MVEGGEEPGVARAVFEGGGVGGDHLAVAREELEEDAGEAQGSGEDHHQLVAAGFAESPHQERGVALVERRQAGRRSVAGERLLHLGEGQPEGAQVVPACLITLPQKRDDVEASVAEEGGERPVVVLFEEQRCVVRQDFVDGRLENLLQLPDLLRLRVGRGGLLR